ncbi:sulfate transporter family-domain-containing protein [Apiospora kogelbergensis]|uniref:sulfate transporter family-domain-containing protein n=1 Tax=Apiospora kogelbergensis TaxID=1337665 RepID=UPI003130051A
MFIKNGWERLQRGMPAVLLGTLFNVLDAVSTGLLVFPSTGNAFANLQSKSMSTYIISSIICQLVMTAGGSLFPGALGAMLIEVLPFMRSVASDIRDALGDDNPAVVPTVMVAYSLSSFLIGIIFLVLGALGIGRLISYFPQTVLTGAIGGIGVSLFVLGLELTLPRGHSLSLSNARSVLFAEQHVPLLLASLMPIVFMCYSVRSETMNRITRGAVQHPYYVPLYFLAVAVIFWAIVGGLGVENLGGLHALAAKGWLFMMDQSLDGGIGSWKEALNYWNLFDFRLVEMSALGHATTNFVLLVVIGVLNLPVYVPALALAWTSPTTCKNHELIGQGAANILAGACGSLPNILPATFLFCLFHSSRRPQIRGFLSHLFAVVLYFVSSYLLRYIPTILASGLVLFLGIELTLEAVWESAKDLIWTEWLVAMATLLACTFMGFAPGIGVGLAAAMVVYTGWGCWDMRAKSSYIERNLVILDRHSRRRQPYLHRRRASVEYFPLADTSPEESGTGGMHQETPPQIHLVRLNGYVFFGVIPSVEAQLTANVWAKDAKKVASSERRYTIVDMQAVHRVETAAARVLRTKSRVGSGLTMVLCGFSEASGTAGDLRRAGLELCFPSAASFLPLANELSIRVFSDSTTALRWCRGDLARQLAGEAHVPAPVKDWPRQQFLDLFSGSQPESEPFEDLENAEITDPVPVAWKFDAYQPSSSLLRRPCPGPNMACFLFILSGGLEFQVATPSETTSIAPPGVRYNRVSFKNSIVGAYRHGLNSMRQKLSRNTETATSLSCSDSTNNNSSPLESKFTASAGHTIFVPTGIDTEEAHMSISTECEATEKAAAHTVEAMIESDPATSIFTWPANCLEAVVASDVEDVCWVVEVCVPCHEVPASSPSITQLRERAIRCITMESRAEP